ncbi:MAG: radical SAM protein [Planctomycetota bacterium]|jgi:hypothetical protein
MAYKRNRKPIDRPPTFYDAALNFTFACNMACVGCDRASFVKPQHSPPMTIDRLHGFLDEVRSIGLELRRMRIVGGEPTLHPDFMEMAGVAMRYAAETRHRCNVRLFSNRFTEESKVLVREAKARYPHLQVLGRPKKRSAVFPPMTRYEYVSPLDLGIRCPHPCPNMGGRLKCGSGVDQVGYSLCPTAGPIDAILGLDARARTIRQMLDPEFVRWQAETICSHCGNFMAYQAEDLPQLWYCNGTPVSATYALALSLAGFWVDKEKGASDEQG